MERKNIKTILGFGGVKILARRLASWLRSYGDFTIISEAPTSFNFWTGVATVAGALERKVWIDEIKYRWYPNFYILLISPPGVATKSSTISVGMRLLRNLPDVRFGPASMTWQGLARGLQEGQVMIPMLDPSIPLLNQEFSPMSALTCEVSELGTFLDMGDGQMQSILIELWDGKDGAWERWLSTAENTRIENPWINVIGATTPTWLASNFDDLTIGGGLTSRIVFVYAEEKAQLIPYISEMINIKNYDQLEEDLIHDLKEIHKMRGSFTLSPEAKILGAEWYDMNWTNPEEHLKGRLSGYRARKQTHIHKLAMILSASESDDRIITGIHFSTALAAMAGIEADMLEVFNQIGRGKAIRHMEEALALIMLRGRISKMELWRKMMHFITLKEMQEVIDGLVAGGFIIIRNEGGIFMLIYIPQEKPDEEVLNIGETNVNENTDGNIANGVQ